MVLTRYGIGLGIACVAGVLVVSAVAARWAGWRQWWRRRQQRGDYDLRDVVARLLEEITSTHDRRQLYHILLKFFTKLVGTENAALLVRNGDPTRLLVRETLGVKPGSFQVGDVSAYIDWLRRHRRAITRRALVDDPAFGEIKPIGLHFYVQFHAEACVPCFLGEDLIAILVLGPRAQAQDYDHELCHILDLLAGQCAVAIHNAHLFEDLTRQHITLQQMGELKSHLLANLSHELRTPLSSVIGLSEVLLEDEVVLAPVEQRQYLKMIHDSGKRLLATVTALMDLAKLENDRTTLDIRRVNVSRLVSEVSAGLKPSPATQMQVNVGEQLPPVYGDPQWIRCVLQHLLENAVKFTRQGRVWVEAERHGDMLKIGVHDTGIGIPKDQQLAVLAGFTQGSNGHSRTHEGTGVGLAIARKVVQIHGGRMWLHSEPGQGSHVYFTLPLKPTSSAG